MAKSGYFDHYFGDEPSSSASPASEKSYFDYYFDDSTQSPKKSEDISLLKTAKRKAGIVGRAVAENMGSIPEIAINAVPNVGNAIIGAYHDLSTPDERVAVDSGSRYQFDKLGDEARKNIRNALTDVGAPLPKSKDERILSDVVGGLTSARSMIGGGQAGTGQVANLLKASPVNQYVSTLLGSGAESAVRETGRGAGAQILASLVAGGGPSLYSSFRDAPEKIAANGLKYTSSEQLEMVQDLVDHSYKIGSPITGAEALAQVNGDSTLRPVQRVIEQSAGGGPTMQEFMQNRPDRNRGAVANSLDDIAQNPAQQYADPSHIPLAMQSAAIDAIKEAKNQRTAATNPFYQRAIPESLDKEQMIPIMKALDTQIKNSGNTETGKVLKNYKNKLLGTIEETSVENVPSRILDESGTSINIPKISTKKVKGIETKIGPLETAYQETRDKLELPVVSPDALKNNIAGKLSPINYELGRALATNANIAQGRKIHQAMSESIINPLESGTVNQIASDSSMRGQASALLPSNPMAYNEYSVANTINKLNEQNPGVAKSWTRQFLQDSFNEAAQNLQSGANQYGAAKFASNITGNHQQSKNLKSAIDASTGSEDAYNGFKKMLDVFEAQGKRLQVGSPTTNNAEIINQLKGGGVDNIPSIIGGATGIATSPGSGALTGLGIKGYNTLSSWYQDFKYGKNTDQMAKILTDPKSIEKLQELAKLRKNSPVAINTVRSIINPLMSDDRTNP